MKIHHVESWKRGEKKKIWRNNGWELPKFDQKYESTHPGITLSSKQGKFKEIHIKIYYHETVERQRKKTLKAAREAIYKESSGRWTANSHQKPCRSEDTRMIYLNAKIWKLSTKNPISGKISFKNKEIKISSHLKAK